MALIGMVRVVVEEEGSRRLERCRAAGPRMFQKLRAIGIAFNQQGCPSRTLSIKVGILMATEVVIGFFESEGCLWASTTRSPAMQIACHNY